jgi:hypothetical protein
VEEAGPSLDAVEGVQSCDDRSYTVAEISPRFIVRHHSETAGNDTNTERHTPWTSII